MRPATADATADGGRRWAAVAAAMAVHLVLVLWSSSLQTPTLDEVAHLPAGMSYWQRGTFRMFHHSPPLARLAAAAPVVWDDPPPLEYGDSWDATPAQRWPFAFEFVDANRDRPAAYLEAFARARTVIAFWSMLTIPILFLWGRWWLGPAAGATAAWLWALSPNLIAHAGLVTTDLAATSMTVVASYAFARWLATPSWLRLVLAALLLGMALLTKGSCLWLVFLWPLWGLLHAGGRPDRLSPAAAWHRLRRPHGLVTTVAGRQLLALPVLAVLTVDAGYLFEGVGTPLERFPFVSATLTRPRRPGDGDPRVDYGSSRTLNFLHDRRVNRFRRTFLAKIPCPLPYWYVAGFDEQKFEAEGIEGQGGYQQYLFGELRRTGWWYYYPVALALKAPPTTWLLLLGGLAVAWRRREPAAVVWGVFALAPLAAMVLLTDIDIGVRYVLPVLPFVLLIAAATATAPDRRVRRLVVLALVVNAADLARVWPHPLSYFSPVAGASANWRRLLIDSNLDWGQDLRTLARWLEKHPEWSDARLAYAGTVPPQFEGLADWRLAPRDLSVFDDDPASRPALWPGEDPNGSNTWGPQPGRYVVSVNFERGMEFHSPAPPAALAAPEAWRGAFLSHTDVLRVPAGAYAYFQRFTPAIVPEVGYSLLLYDLSPEDVDRVRRDMGLDSP